MDENANPQEPALAYGAATPLEIALRQIQAWFVNGDFEKVKQGCREVLTIAPNNSIAQDLLKRAEQSEAPAPQPPVSAPSPAPAPPAFVPTTPPSPAPEPILEEPPMPEMVSNIDLTPPSIEPLTPAPTQDNIHHPHSLAINIAILVGIVVVGILGIYGYNAFIKGGDETPPAQEENAEEQLTDEEVLPAEGSNEIPSGEPIAPSPDLTTWQGRNEKRSKDLSELEQALILYFAEFKKYPNTDEIGMLAELPTPPSDGEAYVYAVYSNDIGADQVFVLSAEFEQENGEKTVWSTGGSPNEYPDYRDVAAPHVTSINPNMTEIEYIEFMLNQNAETPTPPSGRVPRVPRN